MAKKKLKEKMAETPVLKKPLKKSDEDEINGEDDEQL
jgi:hypothetical protein